MPELRSGTLVVTVIIITNFPKDKKGKPLNERQVVG